MPEVLRQSDQWRRAEKISTLAAMDIREIPGRLRQMRRSQADLARHLGLDPSSLTKTIKGDRRVQPTELIKLEAFFGERLEVASIAPQTPRRHGRLTKIPVYGYAAAGNDER